MFVPLVFGLSGGREILSLVVKSYNYSQLVFLWVVGIRQQILISVSGFSVNFNSQAAPLFNTVQEAQKLYCLLM